MTKRNKLYIGVGDNKEGYKITIELQYDENSELKVLEYPEMIPNLSEAFECAAIFKEEYKTMTGEEILEDDILVSREAITANKNRDLDARKAHKHLNKMGIVNTKEYYKKE